MDNKEKAQLTWEILQRRKKMREVKKAQYEEIAEDYFYEAIKRSKKKVRK